MLTPTYPTEFKESTYAAARYPYSMVVLEVLSGAIKRPVVTVSSNQVGAAAPSQVNQGYLRIKKETLLSNLSELNDIHEGWAAGVYSDALGRYSSPERLTLTYPTQVSAKHFALWTDEVYMLRDFDCVLYRGNTVVKRVKVVDNNSVYWSLRTEDNIVFDKMELLVSRVKVRGGNAQVLFFGPIHRLVFTPSVIKDYTITEDLVVAGDNPLGHVNANMLSLAFENVNNWFTVSNMDSPLYKLFYKRMRLTVLGGFKVLDRTFELLPLGTFYSTEWVGSKATLETTVQAYDKLSLCLNDKIPPLPAYDNITIPDLARKLLSSYGYVEGVDFVVDPRIAAVSVAGWMQGILYSEMLQQLSIAGNFYINCNRRGVIQLMANSFSLTSVATYSDKDLLLSSVSPQLYREVYDSVDVEVYSVTKGSPTVVWSAAISVDGKGAYEPALLSLNIPSYEITDITLPPALSVTTLVLGANAVKLKLHNDSNSTSAGTVEMRGRPLEVSHESRSYGGSVDSDKRLSIDSFLIQTKAAADTIGNRLLHFITDSDRETINEWRADLRIELGDCVDIVNDMHGVVHQGVIVKSLTLNYNGGFQGSITTQREMT